jgi:hypothetical protein
MNNIEKEFVPYEEALELNPLGFDEPCFGNYVKLTETQNTFFMNDVVSEIDRETPLHESLITKAPTFSQSFRFFREKYKLVFNFISYSIVKPREYHWSITWNDEAKASGIVKTYEEAEQACLDKLIEICKNK